MLINMQRVMPSSIRNRNGVSLMFCYQIRGYAAPKRLEGVERDGALKQVSTTQWTYNSDKEAIEKQFQFKDFKQAWAFMSGVAYQAEEMNHHPEWFNVYNRVNVLLRTHDCNGLSMNDIQLAQHMDQLEQFLKNQETSK